MDHKRIVQIRMAAAAGSICDYAKELRALCGPLFDGNETRILSRIEQIDTKLIDKLIEYIQWLCNEVKSKNQELEKLREV